MAHVPNLAYTSMQGRWVLKWRHLQALHEGTGQCACAVHLAAPCAQSLRPLNSSAGATSCAGQASSSMSLLLRSVQFSSHATQAYNLDIAGAAAGQAAMLQCRPTFGIPHLELVVLKASQPVQAGVGGPLLQVVWVGGHAQHLQPAGGCRPATRPCTQCTDLVCSDGLQCVAVSKGRPGAACLPSQHVGGRGQYYSSRLSAMQLS